MYVCMYVCLYVCMYVCMYIYIYIYIYMYTHFSVDKNPGNVGTSSLKTQTSTCDQSSTKTLGLAMLQSSASHRQNDHLV